MASQTGTTTSAVNLRAGPGTQHPVRLVLAPKTPVELIDPPGAAGDWLHVRVLGQEGYVHSKFVLLSNQLVPEGFLREKVEPPQPAVTPTPGPGPTPPATGPLADIPLEPLPEQKITFTNKSTGTEKLVGNTWNKVGGLLTALSNELKIDPAVAVAVLAVESGGRGFGPDGRMLIRFENQIFFDRWGKNNLARYNQHFRFSPEKRWMDHKWRSDPNGPWLPTDKADFHGSQDREWQVFSFARALDDTAAKSSISMGGPQIMGFNYPTLGFESVQQMFDAFSASERNQIVGFFDFVQGPSANSRRVLALQTQDFETFASMYNGPGQAAKYGSLIKNVYDTFHRLKPS